jgi:hypothetical protein
VASKKRYRLDKPLNTVIEFMWFDGAGPWGACRGDGQVAKCPHDLKEKWFKV